MLEAHIRPVYQKIFIEPVMSFLDHFTQCTPEQITYFSIVIGVLAAIAIIVDWQITACVLLLVSGYGDSLDGSYARKKNLTSPHGAVLDIVVDRIVEFFIIFALFMVLPVTRGIPAFFMLGSSLICITSFLVVGIFSENKTNKSFHYSVGLIERPEAFIFFVVMIMVPAWFVGLAWLYTALVLFTATRRVRQFLRTHI